VKEIQRISQLFEKGYNGSPWIDVNLLDTLHSISAEKALKKITPAANSIWEITNHLISWRKNVLQRIQGKEIKTPAHNYFLSVQNNSAADWEKTMDELAATQKDWLEFLENLDTSNLDKVYAPNKMTYYEHIQGILQHDAYHLGQIIMLCKLTKKN
jgi:uncharacterized damage-inducible protein DinB